jgi:DnaJ-class molecular chaperone
MAIRSTPIHKYYDLLGVAKNTSSEDIKHAFRKLAFLYHPDYNHEELAREIFKKIKEAYEVLIDPESRADYDKRLDLHIRGQNKYPQRKQKGTGKLVRLILKKEASSFLDAYLKAKFGKN